MPPAPGRRVYVVGPVEGHMSSGVEEAVVLEIRNVVVSRRVKVHGGDRCEWTRPVKRGWDGPAWTEVLWGRTDRRPSYLGSSPG